MFLRQTSDVPGPEIRRIGLDDLDEVMAIERAAYTNPRPRGVFMDEIVRDWSHLWLLSPTTGARPVAFIDYDVERDEAHILNLATHPAHRRRGYATRLLVRLLARATGEGIRYITLEVRRSNQGAISIYRRLGFEPLGVRPRYYVEHDEDALIMLHTV